MNYERWVWVLCAAVTLMWVGVATAGREPTLVLVGLMAPPAAVAFVLVRIALKVGASRR